MKIRILIALSLSLIAGPLAAQTVTPVIPVGAAVQQQMMAPQAPSAPDTRPLALDARQLSLGGALKTPELWQAYKAAFITESGRVVDTGNGLVSHSEGQGYGMLLAIAANDRATFDRLWGWTRANLMVRDDQLLAWRWDPTRRPAIADINDASDGDILVAWALTEASEFWGDVALKVAARRIAVEVGRKLVVYKTKFGALLLPAVSGFAAEDRQDGPVVNLSYWVFPAFARLPLVAPEIDWRGIVQSGLDALKASHFGVGGLPTEWVSLRNGVARPADGFPAQFGYNAIRIPLYLAWAGIGERVHYDPFAKWAKDFGGRAVVDISSGREASGFGESGYQAIGALALCVTDGKPLDRGALVAHGPENYYPATLRILVNLAAQMRFPSCLR
ncbi:MAG: cellulase [Hyphomicrobiales bacterium]|nr:cellulase [Hyphomicrobiales bacterium]